MLPVAPFMHSLLLVLTRYLLRTEMGNYERGGTMRISEVFSFRRGMLLLSCMAILSLLVAAPMWAQSTVATGSIQGTVTDPSDAVVSSANITITNKATGQTIKIKSSSSGTYQSGALTPGEYEVRIEAPGFQTTVTTIPVQV